MSLIVDIGAPAEEIPYSADFHFIGIRGECGRHMLQELEEALKDPQKLAEMDRESATQLVSDIVSELLICWSNCRFVFPERSLGAKTVLNYTNQSGMDDAKKIIAARCREREERDAKPCDAIRDIYLGAAEFKLAKLEELVKTRPNVIQDKNGAESFLASVNADIAHAYGQRLWCSSSSPTFPVPPADRVIKLKQAFGLKSLSFG